MLMLARIESDQQVFEIVSVDVADVACACLENRRQTADAKRIGLNVEPDRPACRVRADREGLREILENLVDNAIKYTPEGGDVSITWQPNGSLAQISVRDTGIGIKPDDQCRVFERFYRVDKARSRELGGTGLGLAIVKHLAQSFGGKVGVQSEVGQGSTFWVELPLG
jgi:two-component system phosphate regulon sensor histidine kinase PhoR